MANLERYLSKDAAVTKGADESPEKAAVEPSGAHDDSAKAPQIPAIQQIDQLVGAAAFKEFCHNVEKQADFVRRNKTQKVFLSTAFLFSIPFGCGFSRATKLLAALLQENGILEEGYGFKDVELPSPVDADASSRMANLVGSLEHSFASANVITVDVTSWADSASSDDFKKLLLNIHRNSGKALVILKTLLLSAGSFILLKAEIQDVLPVCPVVFEPFDAMETRQVAAGRLAKFGMGVSDNAWPIFDRIIEQEQQDGRVYGIHTIEKVAIEMVRATESYCAKNNCYLSEITAESIASLLADQVVAGGSALDKLDKLVGMESIKAQILVVVNQIVISRSNPAIGRPSMHMRFVGNPGTGKTTVARIIGEILRENGTLRIGGLFEHKGRDLCGAYVGQTAPKTTKICQQAYGSVLFIDEAYSLFRGDQSTNDYGREAIDTLITEMENHSDDLMVIMASYPQEMEILAQSNPGLDSRMPYVIEFPNYTRQQLFDIYMAMVEPAFPYDNSLVEAAKTYFLGLSDQVIKAKSFGNARFVRNIHEHVWGKAGMRCGAEGIKLCLIGKDFDDAVASFDGGKELDAPRKIGFV